jgi:hypothetical protein
MAEFCKDRPSSVLQRKAVKIKLTRCLETAGLRNVREGINSQFNAGYYFLLLEPKQPSASCHINMRCEADAAAGYPLFQRKPTSTHAGYPNIVFCCFWRALLEILRYIFGWLPTQRSMNVPAPAKSAVPAPSFHFSGLWQPNSVKHDLYWLGFWIQHFG